MLLQHKIFVGYFFSVAIIGIMVAILLYEQSRIKEIAANSVEINDIRQNVTVAHREITELATLGESVIGWDEEDCRAYRTQRLRLDSLLLALRRECVRFVRPEQVDTLRMLVGGQRDAPAAHHAERPPAGGDGQPDRPQGCRPPSPVPPSPA